MAIPTGCKGEHIASLMAPITGVPVEHWIDAATYAAFAIGGPPLEFSPAPDRIPTANTLGAEEFIAGRTLAPGRTAATDEVVKLERGVAPRRLRIGRDFSRLESSACGPRSISRRPPSPHVLFRRQPLSVAKNRQELLLRLRWLGV